MLKSLFHRLFIYLFIHSFIWIAESDVASLIVICFSFSCYHDCGNHGVCSADFTCDCNLGWLGENCSVDCGCNGHSDCSQGIGICDNCQGKISWDKFRINGYGHSGGDCDVWSAYSYSILFFCDCQSGSLKSAVTCIFRFCLLSAVSFSTAHLFYMCLLQWTSVIVLFLFHCPGWRVIGEVICGVPFFPVRIVKGVVIKELYLALKRHPILLNWFNNIFLLY